MNKTWKRLMGIICKEGRFDKINITLILLVVTLCGILFLGFIFVNRAEDWWGNGIMKDNGAIGDYFNGMIGPFIAFASVITTFAAFYIQFRANEEQKKALADQGKQIKEQQEQQRIDRFEQRFFEMLRIHRENAAAMHIKAKPFMYYSTKEGVEWGNPLEYRPNEVVRIITTEFDLVYTLHVLLNEKQLIVCEEPFEVASMAYDLVFAGAMKELKNAIDERPERMEYFFNPDSEYKYDEALLDFSTRVFSPREGRKFLKEFESIYEKFPDSSNCPKVLRGYSGLLSTYFRHAFQMFAELDSFISPAFGDEERKRFAKLFRAQLTDEEQRMFYYNSLGTAGKDWWKKGYITKYQLIKNVDLSQIPKEISPVLLLNDYLKNPGDAVLRDHLDRYLP